MYMYILYRCILNQFYSEVKLKLQIESEWKSEEYSRESVHPCAHEHNHSKAWQSWMSNDVYVHVHVCNLAGIKFYLFGLLCLCHKHYNQHDFLTCSKCIPQSLWSESCHLLLFRKLLILVHSWKFKVIEILLQFVQKYHITEKP